MLTAGAERFRKHRRTSTQARPPSEYDRMPAVVRWSFVGFAGTMPLEAVNFAYNSSTFSIARLSGLFFIAAYLFFHNPLSGKRTLPPGSAPLWWFSIYLLVFVANGIFLDPFYHRQFLTTLSTLTQLLLLFWISSSLLRVEQLARHALLAFALGAVICAVGGLVRVPGFTTIIASRIGERVTVMDANPNYMAYTMGLAAVILIAAALEIKGRYAWTKYPLMALVLPLLALIVQSGSRTGLVAFAIGFVLCMLPNRQSLRLPGVLLLIFVTVSLVYLVLQHPTMLSRFEESYAGNLAGRQVIIPASWEMILEQPVLGWQPVAYWEELGRRVGQIWGARDAHNLVFHLLLEVGALGAMPFLIGIWICFAGAWKARSGRFGNLPFALLAMTLSSNLSHTYLARKPQWLVLAFAVAAAATAVQRTAAARYLIRHTLRSSGRAAGDLFPVNARQR